MPDLDPKRCALLLIDLQNDTFHPKGAFGRAHQLVPDGLQLIQRLRPAVDLMRANDAWIVSTHFTLVPGKRGEPFIADYTRKMRPFLKKGDYLPGAFGHRLVDELAPADIAIEKISFSAFYMTRLEWVLHQANIETLLVAGFSTNGSVSSTVRDAHLRDFKLIVIEDGCTAVPPAAHQTAIHDLSSIAMIRACRDLPAMLKG